MILRSGVNMAMSNGVVIWLSERPCVHFSPHCWKNLLRVSLIGASRLAVRLTVSRILTFSVGSICSELVAELHSISLPFTSSTEPCYMTISLLAWRRASKLNFVPLRHSFLNSSTDWSPSLNSMSVLEQAVELTSLLILKLFLRCLGEFAPLPEMVPMEAVAAC